MDLDSYKTICTPTENVIFKEKNSKFFGFSFPIANEEDVKVYLEGVKKYTTQLVISVTLINLEKPLLSIGLMMMENQVIVQECLFLVKFNLMK